MLVLGFRGCFGVERIFWGLEDFLGLRGVCVKENVLVKPRTAS